MSSRHALFLAGLAMAALPLRAADPPRWILEQAVEAQASSVVLPSGAAGMLVVTRCAGCAPQSFVTSSRTRYFVAKDPVALAALRAGFVAAPGTAVTVLYDARSHEVTRVIASGTLTAALRPRGEQRGAHR